MKQIIEKVLLYNCCISPTKQPILHNIIQRSWNHKTFVTLNKPNGMPAISYIFHCKKI